MTTQKLRTQLENAGYKVITVMDGKYLAKKGQQMYAAESIR